MHHQSTAWLHLPASLFRRLGPARHGLLIVAVLLALAVAVPALLPHEAAAPKPATANPHTVWRICQERASAALKAPASADFPSYDEHAMSHSGSLWVVKSYVDAQNSFGAQIRTRYECTASFHADDSTYDIESFSAR